MLIEKSIFIYGVIISVGYGVVTTQGYFMAFVYIVLNGWIETSY